MAENAAIVSAAFSAFKVLMAELGDRAHVTDMVRATAMLHGYVLLRIEHEGVIPEAMIDQAEQEGGELAARAIELSERRLGPGGVAEA